MLTALENAIAANDAEAVQQAIFDLGEVALLAGAVGDSVAFEVLAILKRPDMRASPHSGHLLNFFEFEADRISQRAKDRCAAFLREWGDTFTHVHSRQVVAELKSGPYLKEAPPKTPRKKPRRSRT